MPDHSQRVLQHPVVQALDTLKASLADAEARASEDPTALDLIGRLDAIREHARSTLTTAEPVLVTDQVLGAALPVVQRMNAHVTTFSNGTGIPGLQNAMGEADNLLGTVSRVPTLITGPRAATVTRALGAYHETVEQYTSATREAFTQAQTRLAQLATTIGGAEQRIAAMEGRIDAVIAQYQATFDSGQAQRQQTFDSTQAQRQQTFDSEMANHRTEFNAIAQQLRNESASLIDSAKTHLADTTKALDDAIGQAKAAATKAAKDVDAEYRSIADALKSHLEGRRGEADKLVGIIGERGVTSSYQQSANEARREMIVWHAVTVLVLGGLVWGVYAEFVPALQNGWNWGIGGARLMIAVIATLLASYAATQAKLARDTMLRNRRREMDLAAIGPYLQPLPEEQQNQLRTRVADRYFAQEDGTPPANGSTIEALLHDPDVLAAVKAVPKGALMTALKGIGAK